VLGQEFLSFQWDVLLLEVTVLAILWAPLGGRLSPASPPPHRAVTWMFRWLVFRLMLASGVAKLASGDRAWRELRALDVHYETQPLPSWVGWWAHQLPSWAHTGSVAAMFVIELLGPFLALAPRRLRMLAFAVFAALQVAIAVTGNYGFFNLMSVILFVTLLDDDALPGWLRRPSESGQGARGRAWPRALVWPACGLLALLSIVPMARLARGRLALPAPLLGLYKTLRPLRLVNGYGLFAVMTTERIEIVIEGSLDGVEWRPYRFRYKPGPLDGRPRFVAPHQPRLDWQMWFAALGREPPWFRRLCVRLLSGSPEVLALLDGDPFPDGRPRYIRSVRYRYRFTDRATRSQTGAWWRREPLGGYGPVLSRRDGTLDRGDV